MAKHIHEIRDPVHVFVRLDSEERKVVNSRPFQRLRYIHQLAMTYLVYPSATHRRFEHSLGVMELASRVFDIVTDEANVLDAVRPLLPPRDRLSYWRQVLRVAALCHDLGHMPFSHGAEDLLPDKKSHEDLTIALIRSEEMREIWDSVTPPLRTEDIVKLAVGPKTLKGISFSNWEAILASIIVGDAFGADRMDYLLRDSLHAGVAYGRFDHYRLIDTLRILPQKEDDATSFMLGIEEGGLQSAEALLLARYFMFSQLYCHPVRRIYDIHLKDFLRLWLASGKGPGEQGKYSLEPEKHLSSTDNEILTALRSAAFDVADVGHDPARRIMCREHFKVLYSRNPHDMEINTDAVQAIFDAAVVEFGADNLRIDRYKQGGTPPDFPVLVRDGSVESSLNLSTTLLHLPVVAVDFVFVAPQQRDVASRWLGAHRSSIITPKEGQ